MSEQVFGLSLNQVMTYSAVTSALLAIVLAVITLYYAYHAKRQADASREQVGASNRQADTAQRTLDLLLNEKAQQRIIDVSTVSIQLQVAIQLIEDWHNRINSESFDLPDVIEMLPTSFNGAVASAYRVDQTVAGYMGAVLLYVSKAESDAQAMRDKEPSGFVESPLKLGFTMEARKRLQTRAADSLSVARSKLAEASTRLSEISASKDL
jgi:hypothetical protein